MAGEQGHSPNVALDGTYPEGLPDIGAVFPPADGVGIMRHIGQNWPWAWLIVRRDVVSHDVEEISTHTWRSGSASAALAFQRARYKDCPAGFVVEIYTAVIGGWRLVERAPKVTSSSWADLDRGMEFIWGQRGKPIAVARAHGPGRWWLLVPDDAEAADPVYRIAKRLSDASHASRVLCIKAAERLAPQSRVANDDPWLADWARTASRYLTAGIHTQVQVDMEHLGATGVECAAASCAAEARFLVRTTGPDVAEGTHLTCTPHAAEASSVGFGLVPPPL